MDNVINKHNTKVTLGILITLLGFAVSISFWMADSFDVMESNEQTLQVHESQIEDIEEKTTKNTQNIGEMKGDIKAIRQNVGWIKKNMQRLREK
jgi:cytochrome c biogenesis factor